MPRGGRSFLVPGLAALIVVAGAWAFATSLDGVLALDDVRAIVRNETIRTLSPLSVPLSPPSEATVSGRPLANLSFALNYAFAPPDARDVFEPATTGGRENSAFLRNIQGYHLANLIIHLASALVLFGVVRRTLLTAGLRARFAGAAPWLASAIALVWVVHPLQTAAVTYVVQRVESLMGLFYLLTLYCAVRAWEQDATRRSGWTVAAVVSSACGMATKEVMVTAPLVVALWGYLFVEQRDRRAGRMLPVALAATWVILAMLVYGERRAPSIDLAPEMVWRYLITQSAVIVHYVRLAIVPSPLAFLYDWPLATSLTAVLVPALCVAGALAATVVLVVRRRPAGFLGAWFFLVLAPSSSVLPIATEVAAEHRMYLPLAAVVAAVAVGILLGLQRWSSRSASARVGPAEVGALVVTLAIVVALGVETRARNDVYASELGLWGDNVAVRPDDPRPRVAYGSALARAGRTADAEAELRTAVTLAPDSVVARVRLGSILASQNKADAAIEHLEYALTLRPDDVDAHRFLGEIYAAKQQEALAVTHYERVHAAYPDDGMMAVRLASLLITARDPMVRNPQRALALAERAASRSSRRDPRILEVLSVAQAGVGSLATAAATARDAAALARASGDAAHAAALDYRAASYQQAGRQSLGPRR